MVIFQTIRGILVFALLVSHTLLHAIPLYAACFLRLWISRDLFIQKVFPFNTRIIDSWIWTNHQIVRYLMGTEIELLELPPLYRDRWYVLASNHQNWFDVFAIFDAVHGRIPFIRFFVKNSIHYYPFLNLSIWGLDCPAMKRYPKAVLEANPALRKKDLETARKTCLAMQARPACIMNFVEGTRFTRKKQAKQHSPYQHLLKPKTGGLAFAVDALGDKLDGILDITVAYTRQDLTFWDFLSGRVKKVKVMVKLYPIPAHLVRGDYQQDDKYRAQFKAWIDELWQEKDKLVGKLMADLNAGK